MRILVVGAGATGGYFGGLLARAGRDVAFLVRPARAASLRAGGLQVLSPHGDFSVTPRLVAAGEIDRPFDVVLLAVKAYSLDAALGDLAPAIGPETMIVPALNGMRHMDVIAGRFGARALLGGVCNVSTKLDEAGRIVQLAQFHGLSYGEVDGSPSERGERLHQTMQNAGFNARLSQTIMRDMWEKWLMLSSLGAICCLLRGPIGEIEATPGGADLALRMLDEVVAIVRAAGVAPQDAFVERVRETLTEKGSPFGPSMYRDLCQGYRVEADQIVGDLLGRGRRAGLDTPLLAAAYANLSIYQNRREALG